MLALLHALSVYCCVSHAGCKVACVCAACTADGKGITYNQHINVAVAVTMPDGGLITPVLKVHIPAGTWLVCSN